MSRIQGWLACLLACCLTMSLPCLAYEISGGYLHSIKPIVILSIIHSAGKNSVTLEFDKRDRLPFPLMRHLPSPITNVMAIDFAGVSLACPRAALSFPQSAVHLLNIEQLQVAPPVLRLLFQSSDAKAFKSIALKVQTGGLVIKLPQISTPATLAQCVKAPGALRPTDENAWPLPASDGGAAGGPEIRTGVENVSPTPAPPMGAASATQLQAPTPLSAEPLPGLRGPMQDWRICDATYRILPYEQTPATHSSDSEHRGAKKALKHLFGVQTEQPTSSRPTPSQPTAVCAIAVSQPAVESAPCVAQPRLPAVNSLADGTSAASTAVLRRSAENSYKCIGQERATIAGPAPIFGPPTPERAGADIATDSSALSGFSEPASRIAAVEKTMSHAAPSTINAPAVIVLDAGHGGSDPGAERGDVQEKELTLAIVEKLKHLLESKNVRVRLTRSDDRFVSLEDRARLTNECKPDLFLSVHINSMETNMQATGIETYYQTDVSRDLAQLIHTCLVKDLAATDRNVRKARFYVINHTPYPSVLAEVGFISNKGEREKLATAEYQKQVAYALSDGVITYLNGRSQASALRRRQVAGIEGTISGLPPSHLRAQTFTQNLQSHACAVSRPESPNL